MTERRGGTAAVACRYLKYLFEISFIVNLRVNGSDAVQILVA